ncbi:MAG: hypothetical protein ACI8S6_003859, partial [Myxococcota bacterium]
MDIWRALMEPALAGQTERVQLTAARLRRHIPPQERPRLAAIAARALLAVGEAEAAAPLLDEALAAGDLEAAALARVILPDGEDLARQQLLDWPPGAAADAACDLAWRCLHRGRPDEAKAAITAALQVCPGHIESRRWRQALRAWRPADDVLLPCQEQGWMSRARLRRRPGGHVIVGQPGGLGWLIESGVSSRRLADDRAYAQMRVSDTRVGLELELALCWATLRSGRSVSTMLSGVWWEALSLPGQERLRAARAIVEVALQTPLCGRAGLAAAEVLALAQPDELRWRAALARLLSGSD